MQNSDGLFPITEDVVPATTHLTDPCWKTFKGYVTDKGCTAKRRQVAVAELASMAAKDRRSGKMYIISVTIPTHPDLARAALKEKEATAAAALAQRKADEQRKAELARQESLRKAQEERDLQTNISEVYTTLVSDLDLSVTKKRKLTPVTVTVSRNLLIVHAEKMHSSDLTKMATYLQTEKSAEEALILAQLTTKWDAEKRKRTEEAESRLALIKNAITTSTTA